VDSHDVDDPVDAVILVNLVGNDIVDNRGIDALVLDIAVIFTSLCIARKHSIGNNNTMLLLDPMTN
jgi:hypothetical protein